MLALANQLASRAARLLAAAHEPALWSITTGHRVVGSLVYEMGACEAGHWRLAWFAGADPRLSNYAGPLDGDVEALAHTLSARLGAPVELHSLSV
jgi:hypothetical protein